MQYVLKEMRKIGVPEGIEFKTDNSVHWLLDIIEDAVRYRWLREQHWDSSPLCVVKDPKFALRLGHIALVGTTLIML